MFFKVTRFFKWKSKPSWTKLFWQDMSSRAQLFGRHGKPSQAFFPISSSQNLVEPSFGSNPTLQNDNWISILVWSLCWHSNVLRQLQGKPIAILIDWCHAKLLINKKPHSANITLSRVMFNALLVVSSTLSKKVD